MSWTANHPNRFKKFNFNSYGPDRILKNALELVIGKSYSAVKFDVEPVCGDGVVEMVWEGMVPFARESNRSI